jgi:glyoxylase-like metal-dependent hydrolase (beta-lactamase superfamily II)
VLTGGERIGPWHVAYTPGHASHHVSYLHTPSGTAFVGDTGGVRIPPDGPTLPPTPPPDIDPDAWRASIDLIAAWEPSALAVTHFGVWTDVAEQLDELRGAIARAESWARELGDSEAYAARVGAFVRERTDGATAEAYEQGMPPDQAYPGMERALSRVRSPESAHDA